MSKNMSYTFLYFSLFFFFFNDTATTEIYTLSLHDALPILELSVTTTTERARSISARFVWASTDRKSTRLNSSHVEISYAVFCLKKKKKYNIPTQTTNKIKKNER